MIEDFGRGWVPSTRRWRAVEAGLLHKVRCTICGGAIVAAVGATLGEDAMNKRQAVERHQRGVRHRAVTNGYETCGCPVERSKGLPCLVTTPRGRICHGCENRCTNGPATA